MIVLGSDELPVVKKISLQVHTELQASEQILVWFEALNQPPLPNQSAWWQCQTVLKEGFDNVLNYAHRGLSRETLICLEATRFTQAILMCIWDQGPPFDLQATLRSLPDLKDNYGDHGRGLKIMEKMTDELDYCRTPDGKNCLRMVKYF